MPTILKKKLFREVIAQCAGWLVVLIVLLLLAVNSRTPDVEKALENQRHEENLRAAENYKNELIEYNKYLLEKYNLNKQGHVSVKVTIHTEKTNKESIGNEISYLYLINGSAVRSGDTVTLNALKPVEIFTEIRDSDPSSDDVGDAFYEEVVLVNNLSKGTKISQNIDVHERYGADAGNTAKYKVTYELKLANPINISSKDSSMAPPRRQIPQSIERPDIDISLWQTIQYDKVSQKIILGGCCVFLVLTVGVFFNRRKALMQQYEEDERRRKQFEHDKAVFIARIGGRNIREAAGVPANIKFIENNLPVDNNNAKYGSFTVYQSKSGTRYHCKRGCSSAHQPVHVLVAKRYRLTPCRMCGRQFITPAWYTAYLELKRECQKYGIEEE